MKKVIKLARDRIVEIAEKNNFKVSVIDKTEHSQRSGGEQQKEKDRSLDDNTIKIYVAGEVEYRQRLRDKLQEEVDEYFAEDQNQLNDNAIVELAPILLK